MGYGLHRNENYDKTHFSPDLFFIYRLPRCLLVKIELEDLRNMAIVQTKLCINASVFMPECGSYS